MPLLEYHETDQIGLSVFPYGIQAYVDAEARLPLKGPTTALFAGSHIALVGRAELTPSFPRLGVAFRIAPIAIWDLTVRASSALYFGSFSSLYPLADGSVVADPDYRASPEAEGDREGGVGLRLDIDTHLKGKVGPIIAVAGLEVRRHSINGFRGDIEYTWEPTEQLVIPAHGWTIRRTAFLFVELEKAAETQDKKLWIGALGSWSSCPETHDRNILAGPLVVWKPGDGETVPLLYAGAQAWLESRFIETLPPNIFFAANWSR